ncbi:hypothetical protein FTX61_05415 [Nitriliruptoraceae bacterium ZYF776]|nr:hypothetical protein [Profundirhabdus halotolerans]
MDEPSTDVRQERTAGTPNTSRCGAARGGGVRTRRTSLRRRRGGEGAAVRPRRVLLSATVAVGLLGATLAPAATGAPGAAATAQDVAAGAPSVSSQVVTSFDGTPIVTTLFLPPGASDEAPVPLVLRTHGWGGTGETEVSGTLTRLLDEGYAVLTWDQRGFGCSGGEVRIDDPEFEGRDVSALIDWAVANAPVATDASGDPIVGMTGGSYAGGIQMATAAVDDRLDALAPEIAWSNLEYSLYAGEVINQGWVLLLYAAGKATATGLGLNPQCPAGPQEGGLDPAIDRGVVEFVTSGRPQQPTLDFFAKSSLTSFGQQTPTTVPTLVMQGSVDTLFDLTDGHGIYRHVRDQGVPARFVVFCGGHVACPASYVDAGDRAHLDDAIVAWFARHLKGEDVDTGPEVEYRTNEGVWRPAEVFTTGDEGDHLAVTGEASGLVVVPVVDVPDVEDTAAMLAEYGGGIPALPITASNPSQAVDPRAATFEVAHAADGPLEIVGIPSVRLTASGTHVPLEVVLAPVADALGPVYDGLETVGDLLVGPLRLVSGIVQGIGGISELAGLARPDAHVFVKLVDREAGEVLNLQEGAVRVDLTAGEVTLDVPMPGLAYTLPEGHHLDLQVATHSLMHATGRVPALLDVEVAAAIPATGATAGDDGSDGADDGGSDDGGSDGGSDDSASDDGTPGGVPDGADAARPGGADPARGPLPVTGGTPWALLGVALVAAAARLRRTSVPSAG